MIVEWLATAAAGFVAWLVGLLPTWEPPAWLIDAATGLADVWAQVNSLGVWVPWPVIAACIGVAVAVWVVVVGIKLLRAVAAHIPMFGGSGD